jgi:hypothetical protein
VPRVNRKGEVVAGPGRVWFDDTIISQRKVDGVWEIWTQRPDGTWLKREWPSGCNFIAAGAGTFLATAPDVVFGSHSVPASYRLPAGQDGRGNAALDGTIALSTSPDNIGLVLKRADGSEQHEPDAHLDSRICVLNTTTALWIDTRDGKPRTMGSLAVPLALPGAIPFVGGVVFDRQGTPWWLYHGEDRVGVVLQPFDSFLGYHLGPIPAYYLHAVNTEDGRARITYALNPEETVINATWVDWDAPRMDLRTLLGPIVLPPTDPPVDPPEPPVMACGQIPLNGQVAMRALAARPEINALIRGDDDQRRHATRIMAEQLCFLLGPEWGTKRADPGRPQSKDSISRLRDGHLCNWDYVNGTTRELMFGDGEDITGQVFMAVQPVDHVSGDIPDPPDDPDDPPQPGGITRVEFDAFAEQITASLVNLSERVKALEDFPLSQPLPKDVVRESTHKVVTGPINGPFGLRLGTYEGRIEKKS